MTPRTQDLPDGTYNGKRVKIVARGSRLTLIRFISPCWQVAIVPSREVAEGWDQ